MPTYCVRGADGVLSTLPSTGERLVLGFSRMIRLGVINVSDRASRGEYADIPGQRAVEILREYVRSPFEVCYAVVPDEADQIAAALRRMADDDDCALILTTGGTGPALRDVTPEATESVCEKMLPGFGERMRAKSLEYVPTAILSRQTAGIRGRTLIVNLPGKPNAIRECLDAVFPAIPYCLDLIGAARIDVHESRISIFRPPTTHA